MKISNSKKQLAKIIHENGGWREPAEWVVFGTKSMHVAFIHKDDGAPTYSPLRKAWPVTPRHVVGEFRSTPFANWHQTILSRDEYFHLYPVAKAAPEPVAEAKPTIEQMAADYRNAKDYAGRKQQEADAAKADADAKLAELVAAGKALGLVLSVAEAVGIEPELVITDLRDLREGDIIELTAGGRYLKTECTMVSVPGVGLRAKSADDTENNWWNLGGRQESEWRFIRRPAKGAENA